MTNDIKKENDHIYYKYVPIDIAKLILENIVTKLISYWEG